ncbi:Uu.00g140170.m01.CDS01 [Anthostomella pinea]|uniref:Uu.00g140170.m01.CDS01 n=1 Tax=Anthostomella pinea TaxID=933095 RepID=A0AAI8VQ54_9PEZI|nr:Uu.00g140170.m01.CDS01 [Anthostomella pinea]
MSTFDPFHSQRLVYRAVRETAEDEAFVHSIQLDVEAESGSNYRLLRPESLKDTKSYMKYVSNCLLGVIVCLPPVFEAGVAGEPVGIVYLKANPPGQEHHICSDIGIDIARRYRGRGYGGEAIRWALWYGFQMAGLHRVRIEAFSFNTGAVRLYERLGFQLEGRQRENVWFNGGWHDWLTYGMLEHEWRDMQRKGDTEV